MGDYAVELVFTMGRVGSSAVWAALKGSGGDPLHIHHQNPTTLAKIRLRPERHRSAQDALNAADALAATDGPVLVVSLVRDALERNLSAAFSTWRKHVPQARWMSTLADADAMRAYWDDYYDKAPLVWFDTQMKAGLGIDVYEQPPMQDRMVFDHGRFHVVVMRTDMDNQRKQEILSAESGRPTSIGFENTSNRQGGNVDAYQRFAETAPRDEDYVRSVARSRYQQHFFATDEDEYVRRWVTRDT